MDTVSLGHTDCGIPLFIDRLVHEADGYVLINRIKPHTNFVGPTESGILKMAAIGIGNQYGAEHYHRLSLARSQYEIISTAEREVIRGRKSAAWGLIRRILPLNRPLTK